MGSCNDEALITDAPSHYDRLSMRLGDHTTLRLGGDAREVVVATTREQLVDAVTSADAAGTPVLVLGGGSNLVVGDEGFDGRVVLVQTRGIEADDGVHAAELRVEAGEPWDALVAECVSRGLSGVECLSGIPGLVGATPLQNVGAYGQEVQGTIASVTVYDRQERRLRMLSNTECAFSYRTSALKDAAPRYVVIDVRFRLERNPESAPIRYAELARALSIEEGHRAPLALVRDTVIALRRSKGMVSDPSDPDSVSAGSFFMNPTLDAEALAALDARVSTHLGEGVRAPRFPSDRGKTKVAAAWLIERAGFKKGHGTGRVRISNKHALALVNRGGGTTHELLALAREIRDGVRAAFGVTLEVEPQMVGCRLD